MNEGTLLCEFRSGSVQTAGWIFQNELTDAVDVRLDVSLPVDLTHLKVEHLALAGRQFFYQFTRIFTDEAPLVSGVELEARHGVMGLFVQSNLLVIST